MASSSSSKPVVAAGMILYRVVARQIEYLMMQTSYGIHHWTPPKGHVDPGESELEAAVRETQEEAGLERGRDYELTDEASVIEANYEAFGKPKRVLYWLAELKAGARDVQMSHEHQAFKWVPLGEAVSLANFEAMSRNLEEAESKIRALHKF